MKIGILTFHSQLNYGGVLQCWALQTVLEKMGHEVVVIDRWQDSDNSLLELGYNKCGLRQWIKFWIRSLLGLGDINQLVRVRRTKKFLDEHLHRTPYHFVKWKDTPEDLGVDMLVVGSDQVWHCGNWGDPRAYLLEGAPQIPAIAYAASFGMAELPTTLGVGAKGAEDSLSAAIYKRGLSRFSSISCREKEAVGICRNLGYDAVHVVDPTLLAWGGGAEERSKEPKRRELICYFLSENVADCFDALDAFARHNDCKAKVFVGSAWSAAFPSSMTRARNMLKTWKRRLSTHIHIMDDAGPEEFFKAFQGAEWAVSDSFHALMFSICNGCSVRVLRPSSDFRRNMFARIEEFAAHAKGPLVVDSFRAALESFAKGESVDFDYGWVAKRRAESKAWLAGNLI